MARANQKQIISISTGTIVKAVAILLLLAFLWVIRDIVVIVLFALIIAAAVDPLIDWMHKHKIPRIAGVMFMFLLIVGIILGIVTILIPPISEQISDMARQFSSYFVTERVDLLQQLQDAAQNLQIKESIRNFFSSIGDTLSTTTGGIFSTVSSFFGGLFSVISVTVLTFYLTVDEHGIKKFFSFLVPSNQQGYVNDVIGRIQKKLGAWLRTYLLMGLLVGIFVYLGLTIMGVDYALVLALLAGMLEFVPYVGPTVATVPALFLAYSISPLHTLLVLVLYIVVNQIESNFIAPRLLGKSVGLNPVIIIIVILIGAKLAGIVGLLLAVPVTIALQEIAKDIFEKKKFGKLSTATGR